MARQITAEIIESYRTKLVYEEKSMLTIKKYIRDIGKLKSYAEIYHKNHHDPGSYDQGNVKNSGQLTKEVLIAFKDKLYNEDHYKIESVNSILEAVNRFFEYMEWYELRVKPYRVQMESFTPEERHMSMEEYKRLLSEAKKRGKKRLYLIMEVLASTGMRVSEIRYITVASLRTGIVEVNNKGKIRKVLLTQKMKKQLIKYTKEQNIEEGMVFRTRNGKAIDRTNIWKEMKTLCEAAGVEKSKVFPHSLRRLFARSLYKVQKDLAKIADILGHSNIETTRRYVRETSKEHQKVLERLQLVGGYW